MSDHAHRAGYKAVRREEQPGRVTIHCGHCLLEFGEHLRRGLILIAHVVIEVPSGGIRLRCQRCGRRNFWPKI
jgi:hypothetical protein